MTAIVPFDFERNAVRVENRNGEPWFVLADVCRALDHTNASSAASRLDDDERDALKIVDGIGREQSTTIINESGLYRIIMTSRKRRPDAFANG